MVSLLWDALSDPLMGLIISRTKSPWGRYRPYLLFGGPFLGGSFVLMFAAPLIWTEQAGLACLLSHLFFRSIYTVVSVPFSTLTASITSNSETRTLLSGSRMQFATIGAITTAFLTPVLADFLGQGNARTGFGLTAIVYAIIAEIVILISFLSARETSNSTTADLSFSKSVSSLRSNNAFWCLFIMVVLNTIATTTFTKSLVYYAEYFVDEPNAVRNALTLFTTAASGTIIAWTFFAKHFSKSVCLLGGFATCLVGYSLLLAVSPETEFWLYTLVALVGCGTAGCIVAYWAILPDTVEYGETRSGIREEGLVFGLFQLSQKAASGLGVGIVGLVLSDLGYKPNLDQTNTVRDGIRFLGFGLPALLVIPAIITVWFSPLRRRRHSDSVG